MSEMMHEAMELTEEIRETLEARIARIYKAAEDDLTKKAEEYFKHFEARDAAMKAMLDKDEITEEHYQNWRLAQIARGKRYEIFRDECAARVTRAAEIAADYVNADVPSIASLNHNWVEFDLERQGASADWLIWDEDTIRALMVDQPDLLPEARVDIPKNMLWDRKLINDEITSAIIQGEELKKIVERIERVTTADRRSAIRTARTITTAAAGYGEQKGYADAESLGIEFDKRWLATLDGRTRNSHGLLDGQTRKTDEPFESVLGSRMMYPGDASLGAKAADLYNCRCTTVAVLSGLDLDPGTRRARNAKTGLFDIMPGNLTYSEWAEKHKVTEKGKKDESRQKTKKSKKAPKPLKTDTELADMPEMTIGGLGKK